LRVLVEHAGHGVGQAAVLQGEAGIGKTRLLAEIATHAAQKGFQVLAGTTDELSRDRPLGALIEAFELEAGSPDPERAEIGQLIIGEFPVSPSPPYHSSVADLSFRVIDASVALLERLATERPVMVTSKTSTGPIPLRCGLFAPSGALCSSFRSFCSSPCGPFRNAPRWRG
jgi:hypothetical protein